MSRFMRMGMPVLRGSLLWLFGGYVLGTAAAFLWDVDSAVLRNLTDPPVWSEFFQYYWYYAKGLLLAFLCGYVSFGIFVPPLLMAARGYLLCRMVRAAILSGMRDVLLYHLLISPVSLCCLAVLSVFAMRNARLRVSVFADRRVHRSDAWQILRFLCCMLLPAAAGAVNLALAPYLTAVFLP